LDFMESSSKYWPNPSISVGGGQQGWLAFALRRQRSDVRIVSGAPVFLGPCRTHGLRFWSAPLAWDRKMVTVLLSGEDYLSTNEPSRFSREFKLEALRRMEAGENVSDLARQLGVSRKSIYQWRNRYRLGGSKALRGRGRMTNVDLSAHEERPAAENQPDKEARQTSLEELARAQRQISALERKIGQQQVELDFFQQALRQVRDQRLRSGVPGGTASTKSSKR